MAATALVSILGNIAKHSGADMRPSLRFGLCDDNKPFDWMKQSKPIRAWVYVGAISSTHKQKKFHSGS